MKISKFSKAIIDVTSNDKDGIKIVCKKMKMALRERNISEKIKMISYV